MTHLPADLYAQALMQDREAEISRAARRLEWARIQRARRRDRPAARSFTAAGLLSRAVGLVPSLLRG